ncbi:50S ribosomal protein L22/unknown domain fusion protein [bacterium BMS3Abin06]|nr:50S ribosomal protein L22/unknown domain fusion protein [bacterium BMS3Abin06]
MNNAIISLKPKYVQSILSGEKTIELRKRTINLLPGTYLWIYATLPLGSIRAVAKIESIHRASPRSIWKKFSSHIGLSKKEFNTYVNGSNKVSAIALTSIKEINPPLALNSLRSKVKNFHPPQFFARITADHPVLNILHSLIVREKSMRHRSQAPTKDKYEQFYKTNIISLISSGK